MTLKHKDSCKNAMYFAPIYIDEQKYSDIYEIGENIYQNIFRKLSFFIKRLPKNVD